MCDTDSVDITITPMASLSLQHSRVLYVIHQHHFRYDMHLLLDPHHRRSHYALRFVCPSMICLRKFIVCNDPMHYERILCFSNSAPLLLRNYSSLATFLPLTFKAHVHFHVIIYIA